MSTPRYEQLLKTGELEQARSEAEAALRHDSSDRGALIALAKLAAYEGKGTKAEELLARASRGAGAEDPDAQLVRAALLTQRGDTKGAQELYRKLTQVQPPRAEAFFGLGFLLAGAGDYPAARKALERSVQLDPEAAAHHFHLARVLFALEDIKGGFQHLEKALRLNPRHVPTYLAWAVALQAGGQLEAAEDILRQGLKAIPNDLHLLNGLSTVLVSRGKLPEAAAVAEAVARLQPNDPGAIGNLARFRMAERRFDEALALCRALAARGKATAQSWSVEAMVLEAIEPPDVPGAVNAWRSAMKLDPRDWGAPNNLGNLLMRTADEQQQGPSALAEARDVLEEARRRAPNQPEPILNLALLHARLGEKDKARALARELVARGASLDAGLRDQAERLMKQLG